MFNNYRVLTITKNIEDGESQTVTVKPTEKEAMDIFYYNCNSYGTNPSTKVCEVMVINPSGEVKRVEIIDNSKYIEPTE